MLLYLLRKQWQLLLGKSAPPWSACCAVRLVCIPPPPLFEQACHLLVLHCCCPQGASSVIAPSPSLASFVSLPLCWRANETLLHSLLAIISAFHATTAEWVNNRKDLSLSSSSSHIRLRSCTLAWEEAPLIHSYCSISATISPPRTDSTLHAQTALRPRLTWSQLHWLNLNFLRRETHTQWSQWVSLMKFPYVYKNSLPVGY